MVAYRQLKKKKRIVGANSDYDGLSIHSKWYFTAFVLHLLALIHDWECTFLNCLFVLTLKPRDIKVAIILVVISM